MPASTMWVRKAAKMLDVSPPIAIGVTPPGPQPRWRASSSASQYVSELTVVTPIRAPFRSASDLAVDSFGTAMPMKSSGPAPLQTASSGEPLAISARSVPAPTPRSRLPAAIA